MQKKSIIIIVLVLIIGAATYAYYMYNKPVSGLENADTDHQISATELLSQYENNEENANEIFLDNVVEVSGIVEKTENEKGKTSIYLKTDNLMSYIICELDERTKTEKVHPGDSITVKGLCTGYLMDVVLIRCVII